MPTGPDTFIASPSPVPVRPVRSACRTGVTDSGDEAACAGMASPAFALRADMKQRHRAAATAVLRGAGGAGTGSGRRISADGRRHASAEGAQPLLAPPTPAAGVGAAPPLPPATTGAALLALLRSTRANALLVALPLAAASAALHWGPIPTFAAAFAALIPLATLLAVLTEELADHLGDTLGGLLTATSGNIPELAVSIAALRRGLFDVVSVSLLGSILSNMLLVLGCCHIAGSVGGGGGRGRCVRHGTLAVKAYSSMLVLTCAALAVGTVTAHFPHASLRPGGALAVSRGVAILLLIMYAAFLVFTMGTHARPLEVEAAAAAAASAAETGEGRGSGGDGGDGEDDDDGDDGLLHLPLPAAGLAMLAVTVAVALASELLTGAISGVVAAGVPARLLSLVILPVAANATEHASSVIVAYKGKMDLAHSIALGSSLQIAVFVLPVCVVAAWAMGIPYTLELDPLLFLLLLLSVLHQASVSADGRSDWLTGSQLICLYIIVALPSAFMKP